MIKILLLISLFLVEVILCDQQVKLSVSSSLVSIDNGFLQLEFDVKSPRISKITADFNGVGEYGKNLVGDRGISLEHSLVVGGKVTTLSSSRSGAGSNVQVKVVTNTTKSVQVDISNVVDDSSNPFLTSVWSIKVDQSHRDFSLSVDTKCIRDSPDTISVQVGNYLTPTSSFGNFQRGVQQMMNATQNYFGSTNKLTRYYALGDTGSVVSLLSSTPVQNVILSAEYNRTSDFRSGVVHVQHGSFPIKRNDYWESLLQSITDDKKSPLKKSSALAPIQTTIAVNHLDFPVLSPHHIHQQINVNFEHLRALYTAVYASPAGALVSYQFPSGVISPTVAYPNRGYWPLFNFYDPDSWFSISAMMYVSDPYINNECRKMLETSAKLVQPDGQLPHHFIGDGDHDLRPTFEAISGATQTGPNIFWALSALQYVKNSGDYEWLKKQADTIRLVIKYITDRYDPNFQLINAPGPLQIDTMIRNNFTSDTNAMVVYLMDQIAEMQDFLNEPSDAYRELSKNIKIGINKWLYRNDHYITQINPDKSTRDFIDYDANLLAVAFNVPEPKERSLKIMKRILSGKCVHGNVKKSPRATFVSEIYYDAANCYGGNTGDSDITMGRIAWAEAHALVAMNDTSSFYQFILDPLIEDLNQHTWLYERYDCDSNPAHNSFYIEYPELIAMLVREIVFGIELGLNVIRINPHLPGGRSEFEYAVGDLLVEYDGHVGSFLIESGIGGGLVKKYRVGKFLPKTEFVVVVEKKGGDRKEMKVTTCEHGVLHFDAPFGAPFVVSGKINA
ncbi:4-hydroxy-tetrahydrodipicolinate reductase [Acrasis kona]|uniref:4-hydroxy-tetrahydrodipicolinate reductase n=1 Tax=Acrasis kona TaxID=1008807 RepID=A0AAW2ZKR2_9EUKA